MHNVNFGDRYTAADRINWFYAKKAAYLGMSRGFAKAMLVLIVGISGGALLVGCLHFAATQWAKSQMIAQQQKNCTEYHNCAGFQFIKSN